MEWITITIK